MPLYTDRCHGDAVLIGPDVRVEIAGVRRGRVRLKITAPPDVEIRREGRPEPDRPTRVVGIAVAGGRE